MTRAALRFDSMATLHAWAKRRTKPTPSLDHIPGPEELLGIMLRDAGIPFTTQFVFHPRRKYRADFLVSDLILVEVDGNGQGDHPGAHRSLKGYEDDRERDAEALALGFVVLRVTTRQVLNGRALGWVQRLLAKRETK